MKLQLSKIKLSPDVDTEHLSHICLSGSRVMRFTQHSIRCRKLEMYSRNADSVDTTGIVQLVNFPATLAVKTQT